MKLRCLSFLIQLLLNLHQQFLFDVFSREQRRCEARISAIMLLDISYVDYLQVQLS